MRPCRERLSKKWGTSVAGSPPTRSPRERQLDPGEPAAAEVDHRVGDRLVERRPGVAEAADAGALAERAVERLPEHDGDVLDRVVLVHPQVARAVQVEVDQRVRRERGQHVVEHADAGRDRRAAGAVERRPGSGCRSRACAARPRRCAPAPPPRRAAGAAAPSASSRRSSSAGVAALMRIDVASSGSAKVRTTDALLEQLARERLGRPAEVDEHEVGARRRHRRGRRARRRLGDALALGARRRARARASRRRGVEGDLGERRGVHADRGGRAHARSAARRSRPGR